MRKCKRLPICSLLLALTTGSPAAAPQEPPVPPGPKVARVEITPVRQEVEVGQVLTFAASAFDDEGHRLDLKPTAWFAPPTVIAASDESGRVSSFLPGTAR